MQCCHQVLHQTPPHLYTSLPPSTHAPTLALWRDCHCVWEAKSEWHFMFICSAALCFMFLPMRKCNLAPWLGRGRGVAKRGKGITWVQACYNADLFRRHSAHFSEQMTCLHVFINIINMIIITELSAYYFVCVCTMRRMGDIAWFPFYFLSSSSPSLLPLITLCSPFLLPLFSLSSPPLLSLSTNATHITISR